MVGVDIPWMTQIWPWWIWYLEHWMVLIGAFAGVMVCIGIVRRRMWSLRRSISWGSAAWATYREIRKAKLLKGPGLVLGKVQTPRGRAWEYLRLRPGRHAVIFGPPGTGKTIGPIGCTALTWQGSLIVLDIKGTLYDLSAEYRSTLGPVYRFNPTSANGDCLNPDAWLGWGTDQEVSDLQQMSHILTSSEYLETRATEYWRDQAAAVLTITKSYLGYQNIHRCFPERYPVSTAGTYQLLTSREHVQIIKPWLTCMDEVVRNGAQELMGSMTPSKRADVWNSAIRTVRLWQDPTLAKNTDTNDVDISMIQRGPRPVTLYLQVSADDLSGRLRPLFRVILDQLFVRLRHRDVADVRWPLVIVLDEFPQLGYMPSIPRMVALSREYMISLMLALQSPNQLYEWYGEHTSLLEMCEARVFFTPNDEDTAATLAKMIGTTTVQDTAQRRGAGIMQSGVQGETIASHGRQLMTGSELLELPPNEFVARIGSSRPIRGKRANILHDPELRRRAGKAIREEAG